MNGQTLRCLDCPRCWQFRNRFLDDQNNVEFGNICRANEVTLRCMISWGVRGTFRLPLLCKFGPFLVSRFACVVDASNVQWTFINGGFNFSCDIYFDAGFAEEFQACNKLGFLTYKKLEYREMSHGLTP